MTPTHAGWLSDCAAASCPRGYIYPKADRAVRDLLRRRSRLVQQHTANLPAIQNLFARDRGRSLNANEVKRLTPETVSRLLSDSNQALAVQATLLAMRGQEGAIDLLEREALAQVRPHPAYCHLQSASGIGQVLGSTILLETGPIERFANAGHYASYCRCVGSQRLSNGKRKGQGNTKNGNRYARLKPTWRRPILRCATTCVFHAKVDTDSTASWTVIPRQAGHLFQGKLDT